MQFDRYWPTAASVMDWIIANRKVHLLRVLGQLIQVAVLYFIWGAVYTQGSAFGGMNRGSMVTYIVVAQIFQALSNYPPPGMYALVIRNGDVLRDLVVPQVYILQQFSLGLGYLVAMLLLTGLPNMLVGIVLFGAQLPRLAMLPAIMLSLLLAMTITFSINFIVGTGAFWNGGSIFGFNAARQLVSTVLGGASIPLTLFPGWLKLVAQLLPFQAVIYLPTALYTGQVTGSAVWQALGQQFLWAVGLLWVANWFFAYSVRKITIPGG